jgi:hypothetical protein
MAPRRELQDEGWFVDMDGTPGGIGSTKLEGLMEKTTLELEHS